MSNFKEIFNKTMINDNEEINLKNTRLTGIAVPLKAHDVVSKEYVDKHFASIQHVHDMCITIKTELMKDIDQLLKGFTKTSSDNSVQK